MSGAVNKRKLKGKKATDKKVARTGGASGASKTIEEIMDEIRPGENFGFIMKGYGDGSFDVRNESGEIVRGWVARSLKKKRMYVNNYDTILYGPDDAGLSSTRFTITYKFDSAEVRLLKDKRKIRNPHHFEHAMDGDGTVKHREESDIGFEFSNDAAIPEEDGDEPADEASSAIVDKRAKARHTGKGGKQMAATAEEIDIDGI